MLRPYAGALPGTRPQTQHAASVADISPGTRPRGGPPGRLPGDGLRPFAPQTGVATSVFICHTLNGTAVRLAAARTRQTEPLRRASPAHRPGSGSAAREAGRLRLACAGVARSAARAGVTFRVSKRTKFPRGGSKGLALFGPRAAAHAADATGALDARKRVPRGWPLRPPRSPTPRPAARCASRPWPAPPLAAPCAARPARAVARCPPAAGRRRRIDRGR